MTYETILVKMDQGVMTVRLNRPDSLNAFNDKMISETTQAFKGAARNREVRSVVITGEGRAFSSGQDLKTLDDLEELNGYLAAEANHCEDPQLQKKLDKLFERLSKIEESSIHYQPFF